MSDFIDRGMQELDERVERDEANNGPPPELDQGQMLDAVERALVHVESELSAGDAARAELEQLRAEQATRERDDALADVLDLLDTGDPEAAWAGADALARTAPDLLPDYQAAWQEQDPNASERFQQHHGAVLDFLAEKAAETRRARELEAEQRLRQQAQAGALSAISRLEQIDPALPHLADSMQTISDATAASMPGGFRGEEEGEAHIGFSYAAALALKQAEADARLTLPLLEAEHLDRLREGEDLPPFNAETALREETRRRFKMPADPARTIRNRRLELEGIDPASHDRLLGALGYLDERADEGEAWEAETARAYRRVKAANDKQANRRRR